MTNQEKIFSLYMTGKKKANIFYIQRSNDTQSRCWSRKTLCLSLSITTLKLQLNYRTINLENHFKTR